MTAIAQRVALGASEPVRPASPARTTTQPGVRFSTITKPADLEALGPEWSDLFAEGGTARQVFQTFEWLSLWASLYVDRRTRLSVVTARVDGRIVLVWPLVVSRRFGLRVLTNMGEPLSQYADAVMAPDLDEAIQNAAFDYVMALPFDVAALRRVRADSAIGPLLARRLGPASNPQAAPYIDLTGCPSVEAFEARFSGKRRTSRRRLRRGLDERGAVSFASHGPSPEAAALISTALGFKRDWAAATGVLSPALRDPRFESFFLAAARAGDKAPHLRVCALSCGPDIVGIEVAIGCRGVLYGHVLAPHPGLSDLAVGKILVENVVLSALEQGYAGIDLMAPTDAYKMEWTGITVPVGDYTVARSVVGALYKRVWLDGGREKAKVFLRRCRPLVSALLRRGEPKGG